jgi:lactate dehydrogenase-like 2-hydroxyacid dehydrogenase
MVDVFKSRPLQSSRASFATLYMNSGRSTWGLTVGHVAHMTGVVMNIGIAGTGKMGLAIGQRLLGLGHSLMVWNRNPARAEP